MRVSAPGRDLGGGRRRRAPASLGEPDVFFTTPGYEGWPLVMLRLAEVDVDRLGEFLTDTWRMRAPALVGDRDDLSSADLG